MKNPISFDEEINAYSVWVSILGVKFKKHFQSASDALDYIERHPKRCFEVIEVPTQELKDVWVSEVASNARLEKSSGKYLRKMLMALIAPLSLYIASLDIAKVPYSIEYFGLNKVWLGQIVSDGSILIATLLIYTSIFFFLGSLLCIVLFVIELIVYRKYIFQGNHTER